jgi:hypothetical protein
MCFLSVCSQVHHYADLEWWMHYMIPQEELPRYYPKDLKVKPSEVAPSKDAPFPGNGLFTTVSRKKGEELCSFPGYWMASVVWTAYQLATKDTPYCFAITNDNSPAGWPDIPELLYVTHKCMANNINAGLVNDEVLARGNICTPCQTLLHTHMFHHRRVDSSIAEPKPDSIGARTTTRASSPRP